MKNTNMTPATKLITVKDNQNYIDGRQLWKSLDIKTDFDKWMPRMLDYGFENEIDFSTFLVVGNHGGRSAKEYLLSINMAKEIAMIQRTELGRQYRRYFIDLEKQFDKPKPRQKLTADFTTDNVRLELFDDAPIKVTEHNGQSYYFFTDLRRAVGYRKSASRPWRNMRDVKKVKVINQDKVPNGIYNVVTVKDLQLIINDHGTVKPKLQALDRFIKEHQDELTEQTTLLLLEPEQTSLALDIPTVDEQVKDFNRFKEFQEVQGWS